MTDYASSICARAMETTTMVCSNDNLDIQHSLDAYYDAQAPVFQDWGSALENRLRSPAERIAYQNDIRRLDSVISRHLAGTGTVMEVGCGPSRLRTIARDRPLILIDRSAAMLHEARKSHGTHDRLYIQACGKALPLQSGSADLAVCTFVLSHLDEIACREVVREISRVLRPGGAAIVADSVRSMVPTACVDIQTRRAVDGRSYLIPKYYRSAEHVGGAFLGGSVHIEGPANFVFTIEWRNV